MAIDKQERKIDEFVEDILSQMTLKEKIMQLGSVWSYELLDENGNFSEEKAEKLLKYGIGQITRPGGATNFLPEQAAKFINTIQKFLVENTRLKIPAFIHEECLTGYMGLGGTNFPVPLAMASTWDPELVRELANLIGKDLRAIGAHQGLAPVLDVARDPRWGRVEETFGESPYLVAKFGTSYISGLQGDGWSNGVIATAKHFVGYGFSEGGRNWAPTNIPYRELKEVFLLPFEAAIKVSKVGSIMNSYSEIDGIPVAASKELLTDILRKELKFDGIVVSDYFSIDMLREYHKLTPDKSGAAHMALDAGIDVELPRIDCYLELENLILNKKLDEEVLNNSVRRVLKMKFMLGLFQNPYVNTEKAALKKHYHVAKEVAKKSIVLLKNEGVLPISKDKKIAFIGPSVEDTRNMLGDYMYLAHVKIMLENVNESTFNAPAFNLKEVAHVVEENLKNIPSILQVAKEEGLNFVYSKGCEIMGDSKELFAEAFEKASESDVIVVFVGDRSGLTKDCTTGESRDSALLKLPGVQEELILELSKIGKPIVVVLITGRPYSLKNIVDKVDAILQVWFPGEIGATAIMDVLLGKYSPSGKLPITFPRSVGQIPLFHYHKPSGGRTHWHGDYFDESSKPLFPFGHGLSYTKFKYQNLQLSASEIEIDEELVITFEVENTGDYEGEEVVQLYIGTQNMEVTRPVKELKGFQRVSLKPHERKRIRFEINPEVLAFIDKEYDWVVSPGTYNVFIGSSSEDIRLECKFEIAGKKKKVVERQVFFTKSYVEEI